MPGGKGRQWPHLPHTDEHLLIWWFTPASQDRGQGKGGEQRTKAQHPVPTTVSICLQYASILQTIYHIYHIYRFSTKLLPDNYDICGVYRKSTINLQWSTASYSVYSVYSIYTSKTNSTEDSLPGSSKRAG
jgi:hypothetical protein